MADKLLVNPIDCEGHGACAELLPEVITLDEWGFPIVDPRPLPPSLERHARSAVSACPTLALRLVRELPEPTPTPSLNTCACFAITAKHAHVLVDSTK